jgi:hypothetical protein
MGEPFPRNRREFDAMFATEESCMDYLGRLRWANGFECQVCRGTRGWALARRVWECAKCGAQRSPTEGTLLHRSRLSLRTWFDGVWHVCEQKNGMSALALQRALGLGSYHTAWEMLHRMRQAMAQRWQGRLSGEVEVDEAFIGGRTASEKAGVRVPSRALVFVAVEINGSALGRARLQVINDTNTETLMGTAQQLIELGTTVVSDGLPIYSDLSASHYNQASAGPLADTGKILRPRAFKVMSLLRRWLLGTHQGAVSADRLQTYLDEFVFRFNCRTTNSRGLLFHQLLQQAVRQSPVPKAAIMGTPRTA